jgi:hypothetical protein
MYKFSRCHVVVFMIFSFHLPIFDKNRPDSGTKRLEIIHRFPKNRLFIGETGRFIDVPGFIVPLSSPVRFGQIFPIFANFPEFFKNRRDR